MSREYNLRNIRTLLIEGFTDEELRRFCCETPGFKPVCHELASTMGKDDIAGKVIEYSAQKLKVDLVLAWAKENNPARYEKHGPYHNDNHTKLPLEIPVVIAAMTSDEAAKLEQQALKDIDVSRCEKIRYRKLKKRLKGSVAQLFAQYGRRREDWRPDPQPQQTIEAIFSEVASHFNQDPQREARITLRFCSTHFFAQDDKTRLQAWDELSWSGCILVIDPISLLHPVIYRRLLQSEMGANPRVAVAAVLLSPIVLNNEAADQQIKQEIKLRMQRAFVRSDWYFDPLCNLQLESLHNFHRWCLDVLPEVAEIVGEQQQKGRPNPVGLAMMRQEIKKPDLRGPIFGQGGEP